MNEIIKIITIPYAGGNRYSFNRMKKYISKKFDLISLEYPGRGDRTGEILISDMTLIVQDLINKLKSSIDTDFSYVLFGHSMGGIVAFEMCHQMQKMGMRLPDFLLITGTSGPSSKSRSKRKWHSLPSAELRELLNELNEGELSVFDNKDLFDYMEPIIRNDFHAISNYRYEKKEKLNIPIMVITGDRELITSSDVRLWESETKLPVEFHELPGGHFFIFDNSEKIINLVENKLLNQNKSKILTI
jgi:surfactin synthase thioesterase subunit